MANKTKIEWCDYTVNPIKGKCKHGCPYCYATRMYDRYKWNPEVRLDMTVFDGLERLPPSKIFVCSTHDIFGSWIPDQWIHDIFQQCAAFPQHTFIFLTKNPAREPCCLPGPNTWFGTSITRKDEMSRWVDLKDNCKCVVNFISFEPLLEDIGTAPANADWIIVGAETGNRKEKVVPGGDWAFKLFDSARQWKIPIFIKDNLGWSEPHREWPR